MSTATRLSVKVSPGASRNRIQGWLDDVLKLQVTAAPERGKANAAVQALIAERLGLPRAAVRIVAGHGSRRKIVEIDGLGADALRSRLS